MAVPLFVFLSRWGTPGVLAGLVVTVVLGVPAADHMERELSATDPGRVVIDEMAGFLVTMAGSPLTVEHLAAGFFLFRFFDIAKPPPVRQAERYLRGGLGIMADDLLAGGYAWIGLKVVERFLF